jgi:hypothetical protein
VFARLLAIEAALNGGPTEPALEDLTWLSDDISALMDHYEARPGEHGIKCPALPAPSWHSGRAGQERPRLISRSAEVRREKAHVVPNGAETRKDPWIGCVAEEGGDS